MRLNTVDIAEMIVKRLSERYPELHVHIHTVSESAGTKPRLFTVRAEIDRVRMDKVLRSYIEDSYAVSKLNFWKVDTFGSAFTTEPFTHTSSSDITQFTEALTEDVIRICEQLEMSIQDARMVMETDQYTRGFVSDSIDRIITAHAQKEGSE